MSSPVKVTIRNEPAVDAAEKDGDGVLVFDDRFQVVRRLKHGQNVTTLLGTDVSTGQDVIIKTTKADHIATGAQMRLEHEAHVLNRIENPNFTPLLHFGRQDNLLYLVTPYLPGETLEARLLRGPLSVSEALDVGSDLLRCLNQTHHLGVLHRDVKPANIVVSGTPTQKATLIDFGLSRSSQLDASVRDLLVGSARYMAPEQAGLLDADIDESSDLYSLGAVLFECLTGKPPFGGETVGQVLRQHMTMRPPELHGLGLEIPRALDEVVQRLLRKDPRDRYQSAEAVLADLRFVKQARDRGEREPELVVGRQDRRRTLTEPAFVGRRGELQSLESHLQQACLGQGGVVLLEASSGGGKSRLLSEFTRRGARLGNWVLRGMAADQVAQQPFQILEGVVSELVGALTTDAAAVTSIFDQVADHRDALVSVFPELAQVEGWESASRVGPELFAEARSISALTALLDALGTAERPALLLLDDVQWANALTVKLLQQWSQRRTAGNGAGRYVLIVVGFRSEEVPVEHPLRGIAALESIALPLFDPQDVKRLAESMAGPLPEDAIKLVEDLAGGSPFMASAVLRGLVESGALVPQADGWRTEPLAMADVSSSRQAAAFLARRIEMLPQETIRLLSVGAVLAKEFDIHVAATLAEFAPATAIAALDEARKRQIVWARRDGSHCVFVHDRLRETLIDRLSAEEKRDLHYRAAMHLETNEPKPVFDLAFHFDAAGDSRHALPYALTAADQARARHSLEVAEQQYWIAHRGAEENDHKTMFRISAGLADVLMLRGRYEPARQQLQAAALFAEDDFTRAKIECNVGELLFKQGDMQGSVAATEQALRLLGHKVPKRTFTFVLRAAREAFVQLWHTFLPRLFLARRRTDGAEQEFEAIRCFSRLAYANWFARGAIPTLWAHLRHMNLAERYPPTLELAQAYSAHAPAVSLIPLFKRGIRYAEKSLEIRKQLNDPWGQGQSLHFWGIVLYAASRFEDCIEKCRESVRLLQRTGDFWEMNIARYQIAASYYRMGDLSAAIREARQIHESGLALGDAQASGISLDVWARAAQGQVPREKLQTELERERYDAQGTAEVMLAEGVRLVFANRFEEAMAVLQQGHRVAENAGVRNAWVTPLLPWLSTAARRAAEHATDITPHQRRQHLRLAQWACRKGRRMARKFKNDLPHVLREGALLAAISGHGRRARKLFDKSLAIADSQGARYELAQTRHARARVGCELNWTGADEQLAQAETELNEFATSVQKGEVSDAPAMLSLVDRFDTLLDVGRRIAAGLSREAVVIAVREAAMQLLRCERCLIIGVTQDGAGPSFVKESGELSETFSDEMIQRTISAGRAIVLDRDENEQLALEEIRSAICVPVRVRGEIAVCIYAFHRQVDDLFGDDEKRLADFIASIAGAALENAQGFSQLQQLAATLEQKVEERTQHIESQKTKLESLNEELGRSNSDLQQFAYVASHDLQEPLRTVASFCSLIQQRYQHALDDEGNEFIDFAIDGAKRMKTLISDLLTFSRVGTRGKPFAPTDCERVLDIVLAGLKIAIDEKKADITRDPLPTVMADNTQLAQLFQNLIANALKFCINEVPQIHIAAQQQDQDWVFSIRDNGIGIAEEHRERVFQIFQRLHSREEYEGTGIGLAVCRKTVERHGGRIWVESEQGSGSTFFFTIPLRDADEA